MLLLFLSALMVVPQQRPEGNAFIRDRNLVNTQLVKFGTTTSPFKTEPGLLK